MRPNTECVGRKTLETSQKAENSTSGKEDGNQGGNKYYCNTIEEFEELEAEFGIAAHWIRPTRPNEAPRWCNRWNWKPEDGVGWPRYGTDVY